jgi:type VI secretion system secreted protein Hcp
MKLGDIKGEATAEGHKDEIKIDSVQFGAGIAVSSPAGGAKSRSASAVSISEITVSKMMDNSSTVIFQKVCGGTVIPKCELFFTVASSADKSGNDAFLHITLEDVFVTGYSMSSGGDGRPSESVSLNFVSIAMVYQQGDEKGVLSKVAPEATWNLATNKA